ncbi:MAG: NirD/YgiW/YdeI family stress tolerance protein [Acinetobacter sp.]|nr:NirD/YgiW/YdeI family stress tolerance protein [Acinetobacter sp.]
MKKIMSAIALMATLGATSSMVMAHHSPDHKTKAVNINTQTISQLADGTPIKIKGYITQSLGDEKYTFKDRAGTIVAKIDDDVLKKRKLASNKVVTLIGEVDIEQENGLLRAVIDVDAIR